MNDPRIDYSTSIRPAALGGECAKCLHIPPLHEPGCTTLDKPYCPFCKQLWGAHLQIDGKINGCPVRIMVDELRAYSQKANTPQGRRYFGEGKQSCHLTITPGTPLDELHKFAEKIGMRREWFQADKACPHYDLTPSRRITALREGAVFIDARTQVIERRAFRERMTGEPGMQSWNFLTNGPM